MWYEGVGIKIKNLMINERRKVQRQLSFLHQLIFHYEDSVHNPQPLILLESWDSQLSPCVIRFGYQTGQFLSYNMQKIDISLEAKNSQNFGYRPIKRYNILENNMFRIFVILWWRLGNVRTGLGYEPYTYMDFILTIDIKFLFGILW